MNADDERLRGGADQGATRRGDVVLRRGGEWTPSVHQLLAHLADHGFTQAPRPVGLADGIDRVGYLAGETVGDRRPWPAWVHSDQALVQVADWLARYHRVVADYRPPVDAVWREQHADPGPDVVIAHNDAAPYNAVWADDRLVGFVDWDMAGPRLWSDDLVWTAFSWVPLHARHVVAAEGFTDFGRRRERLIAFLASYRRRSRRVTPDADAVLARLDDLISAQIALVEERARGGDATYRQMIELGRTDDLAVARDQLAGI